jgi:hypothetical protein
LIASPREELAEMFRTLRPAASVSFSLLDRHPVLFDEATQKIYALNPVAAYIWCSLVDGMTASAICRALGEAGFTATEAADHLGHAMHDWLALGLLDANLDFRPASCFSIVMGGLEIAIQTSSERLGRQMALLFCETGRVAGPSSDAFQIIELGEDVYLFRNGAYVTRCAPEETAPALKAIITEQVLLRSSARPIFHAACLIWNGEAMLLNGPPGAGKTTLAVHLMQAGFGYAGDDIVLIEPGGCATGMAFAPTIKSGAWPIIGKLRPELDGCRVHRRSDGTRVRYLNVSCAPSRSVPIRWIIFIKRANTESLEFTPLGQLDSMRRLIAGSYSPDGKLNHSGFDAMKQVVLAASCFELSYSNADQAALGIAALCNG